MCYFQRPHGPTSPHLDENSMILGYSDVETFYVLANPFHVDSGGETVPCSGMENQGKGTDDDQS